MTPPMDRDELIARLLCEQHGGDPEAVATDEHDCWEGQLWTVFIKDAKAILAALESRPAPTEDRCERCGGDNFTWFAPSPLWNAVMRGGSINGPWTGAELICPICFMRASEQAGIAQDWKVSARTVNVPLETVTPSGRFWDEVVGLWVDPAALATDTTPSRATEAAQIYADFHSEDASYRPECAAKLAALGAPSRDEEGSVDREAIAQAVQDAINANWRENSRMQSLAAADAIIALKISTPETQTVDGGGQ